MGKHYLYSVDVKREVIFYQRCTIAIPESIPEGDRESYINEAISGMDDMGDLCNHDTNDDVQDEEVDIVDINPLDDGPWTLSDTKDWATNEKGDTEQYVHYLVEE